MFLNQLYICNNTNITCMFTSFICEKNIKISLLSYIRKCLILTLPKIVHIGIHLDDRCVR